VSCNAFLLGTTVLHNAHRYVTFSKKAIHQRIQFGSQSDTKSSDIPFQQRPGDCDRLHLDNLMVTAPSINGCFGAMVPLILEILRRVESYALGRTLEVDGKLNLGIQRPRTHGLVRFDHDFLQRTNLQSRFCEYFSGASRGIGIVARITQGKLPRLVLSPDDADPPLLQPTI
jgi:hypothetical protein